MNKQELIKKYKSALNKVHKVYGDYYKTEAYEEVLKDLKRLDEPQKVIVPQFVADLIEYAKKSDWDLEDTFQDIAGNDGSSDIYQWYYSDSNNMDTFARAWLDGYEVEREKRYLVKMKGMVEDFTVLKLDKIRDGWYLGNDTEYSYTKVKHTREELEKAGFGEVFNSQLFEIEEVEE